MNPECVMLSKMSYAEKDQHCIISQICGMLKQTKNKETEHQTHRNRVHICGYQRQGVGELEVGGQKVQQTSSYKVNQY